MTITPELKRALALANGSPLRLEDPETRQVYLVTRLEPGEAEPVVEPPESKLEEVPEGIAAAWDAFRRDLPAMLADKKLAGKAVLYHRGQRIAVGKRRRDLARLADERGIPRTEFRAFDVEPEDEDIIPQ